MTASALRAAADQIDTWRETILIPAEMWEPCIGRRLLISRWEAGLLVIADNLATEAERLDRTLPMTIAKLNAGKQTPAVKGE